MGKLDRYLERMRGRNFLMFVEKWKNICVNLYKWKGLPEGLTSQKLEEFLFEKGKVVSFRNKNTKIAGVEVGSPLLFLPVTGMYDYNIYDIPQKIQAGRRGVNVTLNIDDCVIIKNNFMEYPTRPWVEYYCEKMLNIENSKDLNINASKTPFLITVDNEKQKLAIINFFNSIACSDPLVIVDENSKLAITEKKVLQTGVELVLDKLQQGFVDFRNELLTHLGIDNISVEKRERLVTGEVEQNDEFITDNIITGLNLRKLACEQMNKKFGTNISVEFVGEKKEEVPTENIKEDENKGDEIDE
jgi:hypothetical protein